MSARSLVPYALALALALLALLAPAPARSQADALCFAETGYCVGGRIRTFWERSGGLTALGLPITPVQEEQIEGRARWVQWFERARVELHPENPPPYDVQLGRAGVERRARGGLDSPAGFDYYHLAGNCHTFPETGQRVCGEFLVAWASYGLSLDDDPAVSPAESLALFGLPISGARVEALSDGREYLVQWFERARFEYHPEHGWPYRVLFGRLGSELGPRPAARPGDPAALVEPPLPAPPPPPVGAARPARLVIPSIGLDRPTLPAGRDAAGDFVVLDHDVAWFDESAGPGQGENIVFWGHVLPFRAAPHLPAPFANLKDLPIGAEVLLYDGAGQARRYAVAAQIWALPEEVWYVYGQGREMITMVSCIGDDVVAGGGVVDKSHRLITIAYPAP